MNVTADLINTIDLSRRPEPFAVKDWDDMHFWDTGECQYIDEKLNDLKGRCCPKKENLYAALDATPLDKVKVILVGQDPYPDLALATGVAFSIPKKEKKFPPTLLNLLQEYSTDTHLPYPENGDLTKWCKEGVLLWNAIPSCEVGKSLSHANMIPAYSYLHQEMFKLMAEKDVVFVLSGNYARELRKYLPEDYGKWIIEVSHPSPRGVKFSKSPFLGSRVFTRVNALLADLAEPKIDWSL